MTFKVGIVNKATCKKKKKLGPRSESKFYLGTLLRTTAGRTASQIALRSCPGKVREEPGYIVVFAAKTKTTTTKEAEIKNKQKKTHTVKHQKITANHKKAHTSQINGLYTYICVYIILRIKSKKYRLGEQSM